MVFTEIVKTYKPPVVDGVFTVITYDMPIHWVIRVVNGKEVTVYKAGQDDLSKFDDAKTVITLVSSTTNYSFVLNKGSPLVDDKYWRDISTTTFDSLTVKISVSDNDQKSPEMPHDRVLVLQETKFYVDSNYLSIWSKYFERLFNGDFAEKDAKEIKIEEIEPNQFDELLKVISPAKKEITAENVVFLWKLADRFDIPTIAAMCEQFLTTSPGAYSLPLFDKLNLAIEMKSEKLENQCRAIMEKMPMGK